MESKDNVVNSVTNVDISRTHRSKHNYKRIALISTILFITGLIVTFNGKNSDNGANIFSFSNTNCDFMESSNYKPFFWVDFLQKLIKNNDINHDKIPQRYLNDKYQTNNNYIENINGNQSKFYNIHSHNDYWRSNPLFDALEKNIKSVEADIWYLPSNNLQKKCSNDRIIVDHNLYNNTHSSEAELYVGHNTRSLSSSNTLNSLYIDYFKILLDDRKLNNKPLSLYDNYPNQSLGLIIDIKSKESYLVYKLILKKLEPIKQYLTYYDFETSQLIKGPIHVILSGYLPINELIKEDSIKKTQIFGEKYVFLDNELLDNDNINRDLINIPILYSTNYQNILHLEKSYPIKSRGSLETSQLNLLLNATKNLDKDANARVWGVPHNSHSSIISWLYKRLIDNDYDPHELETKIWKKLILKGGVTMMNVDDLDYGMKLYDEIFACND